MNRKQPPATEASASPFSIVSVKALLLRASAWYASISAAVLVLYIIRDMAPSPLRLLLVLPLSLCLAGAAWVRHSSLHTVARAVCHALLSLGGAYLFAYLPVQIEQKTSPRTSVIFWILSLLVYAVAVSILAAARRVRARRAVEETPYQPQFSKKNT